MFVCYNYVSGQPQRAHARRAELTHRFSYIIMLQISTANSNCRDIMQPSNLPLGSKNTKRVLVYIADWYHALWHAIDNTCMADTGRKQTLFHCKWANSISYYLKNALLKSLDPDFVCPFMNACSKFQSHSYWQ